jgi:hypothetical protein
VEKRFGVIVQHVLRGNQESRAHLNVNLVRIGVGKMKPVFLWVG